MTVKVGVVLAAGLGKRMNSKRHKVVHEICGKAMIAHVVDELQAAGVDQLFVVVGSLEDQVRAVLGERVQFIRQEQQLGTGHAVLQAVPKLPEDSVTVVLNGDCPLIRRQEIQRLLSVAAERKATAVLTAMVENPFAYGRVIRDGQGAVRRIVEEKDASAEERLINEINGGVFAFRTPDLVAALCKLTPDNAQGELLLTDCVAHMRADSQLVWPVPVEDPNDLAGVNDRVQLADVEARMKTRILREHMKRGVTVVDPASTYVQADVSIGRDTVLWPGTSLEGQTVIGEDCVIGPNARLVDVLAGAGVAVQSSLVMDSRLGDGASVGPYAYIRPGSDIGAGAKIGNFVEIKNSTVGEGTKVSHLSYIGDSEIGSRVNIGCGVVTVNYDGYQKNKTVVGNDSFVGSSVNLIAPVHVGSEAYIATGSTITDEVPDGAFAIARERQTTKPEYAIRLRMKLKELIRQGLK